MQRIPPELTVEIPPDRIAQYPAVRRDGSKLLVYDRSAQDVVHVGNFPDVTGFIAGDLIVLNDSRVIPARFEGQKPGGGRVELLFTGTLADAQVYQAGRCAARALVNPTRRLRTGLEIALPGNAVFTLKERNSAGGWNGSWSCSDSDPDFWSWLQRYGSAPLPPYIHRKPEESDIARYQTVYAANDGSLAAPTAGLHITDGILDDLIMKNSRIEYITLHVWTGTFHTIESDDVAQHVMHAESFNIPLSSAEVVNRAKESGNIVTVVGTTVVRALEAAAVKGLPLKSGNSAADIFIYPPYEFLVVDRLLTNFHRPDSTLMQLVAAFMGWEGVNCAYGRALAEGFRFYSYGDAMLIL